MTKCLLCKEELTEATDSREHIVPNSIGGIRKTKGFICISCNGKAGETWDAALSEQMNKLSLFFRVVRDRGENKRELIETTAGEKLIFGKNSLEFYSPKITVSPIDNGGVNLNISAKDIAQARQILEGQKRKYKNIDVEEALKKAKSSVTYPSGAMHFELQWGGVGVGRSWVKTALALLSDNGIDPIQCINATNYLIKDGEPCFGYYYKDDLIKNRPAGVPLHCVVVIGSTANKTIQGYLEYFGMLRIVLNLCDEYTGPDFKVGYAIDPTMGKEIDIDFDFQFSEKEIADIYDYKYYDYEVQKKAMGDVIGPELKKQQEGHFEAVLTSASAKIKEKFSGEEMLTGEQISKVVDSYMQELEPHLVHWIRNGRDNS
ncbi:HNH endonuclease [Pseudomonas saponiphila]